MQSILTKLELADFEFLLGIIRSPVGFTSDGKLRTALDDLAHATDSTSYREKLCVLLEQEIRYLGSSDVAYLFRKIVKARGGPGVPFRELVTDVSRKLKLADQPRLCTDEELLERLVQAYTSARMRALPVEEQRALLEDAGMSAQDVRSFLRGGAARFAIPALIQVAGIPVAQKLITNAVIGTVSAYIGREAAKTLIGQLAARFPLWGQWLGPIAWGVSGLWTAYDLQGPATRKTIPITLYLGLCMLRDGGYDEGDAEQAVPAERQQPASPPVAAR